MEIVSRPWGTYEVIRSEISTWVKKITVNPHQSLSLQKHSWRAELWLWQSGDGTFEIDGEVISFSDNPYPFIKLGAVHRATSTGDSPLVFYEVAYSNWFLSEDDIIRLEDNYGRADGNTNKD